MWRIARARSPGASRRASPSANTPATPSCSPGSASPVPSTTGSAPRENSCAQKTLRRTSCRNASSVDGGRGTSTTTMGGGRLPNVDLRATARTLAENVVCVLDPELVLLSGGVAQAGGETLCELVSVELLKLVVPRTPVQLAQITTNPVRSGALHSALAVAREQVFGLPQRG